jgi:hypothetical protein
MEYGKEPTKQDAVRTVAANFNGHSRQTLAGKLLGSVSEYCCNTCRLRRRGAAPTAMPNTES